MPPPNPFYDLAEAERELFAFGKQVLGVNAGGLIVKLLKARKNSIGMTRQLLELAATKQDPREYIAAAMRKEVGGSVSYFYRKGRRISPAPFRSVGKTSPQVIEGFEKLKQALSEVPDPILELRKTARGLR